MKKVTVDPLKCVACGACVTTVPEVFELVDGLARAKEGVDAEVHMAKVDEAIAGCAVGAISWVEEGAADDGATVAEGGDEAVSEETPEVAPEADVASEAVAEEEPEDMAV